MAALSFCFDRSALQVSCRHLVGLLHMHFASVLVAAQVALSVNFDRPYAR